MLPFYYTFLILMLGSSVIAMSRSRYRQPPNQPERLLHNRDIRLPRHLWARVEMSEESPGPGFKLKWENAWHLDDVLWFSLGSGLGGVETVGLRRIIRKFQGPQSNEYHVVRARPTRTYKGPAATIPLKQLLPIEDCASYLNNTYWGRIPKILGTGKFKREPAGSIIHIQWMSPTTGVEVPYVTFKSANVISAEDRYELNSQQVTLIRAVGWRVTGFMSREQAVSAMENMMFKCYGWPNRIP